MEEQHDHNSSSTEDASITRNFRYMRRKPTIISYKPPQGKLVQSFKIKFVTWKRFLIYLADECFDLTKFYS